MSYSFNLQRRGDVLMRCKDRSGERQGPFNRRLYGGRSLQPRYNPRSARNENERQSRQYR